MKIIEDAPPDLYQIRFASYPSQRTKLQLHPTEGLPLLCCRICTMSRQAKALDLCPRVCFHRPLKVTGLFLSTWCGFDLIKMVDLAKRWFALRTPADRPSQQYNVETDEIWRGSLDDIFDTISISKLLSSTLEADESSTLMEKCPRK